MVLPFDTTPTLIGHRGLGKGVVNGHGENTMTSFLAALGYGRKWIEVDIRRSVDDGLFVAHDATSSDGWRLSEMTGEQAVRHGALSIHELGESLPNEMGVVFDISPCWRTLREPQP